jgi:hypothetical protein
LHACFHLRSRCLGISKSPRSSLHGHDPAVAGEKGKTKATPAAASERGEVITDLMMALLYTAMESWHSIALAGKYQFQNPDRQALAVQLLRCW